MIIAKITSKQTNQSSRYFEEAFERNIAVLNFLSKSLKGTSERLHFGNVAGYNAAALLKNESFLRHFFLGFTYIFNCENYRRAILKKIYLIRTLPRGSAYANNFVRNRKNNISFCTMYQYTKF